MTYLVDLQSALRLLTNASSQTGSDGNAAQAPAQTKTSISSAVTAQPAISGALPGPTGTFNLSVSASSSGIIGSYSSTGAYDQYGAFKNFVQDFESENSMTDQQLADAVYDNTALSNGMEGKQTFSGVLNTLQAVGDSGLANELSAALADHTLQVQNGLDVPGLDLNETLEGQGNVSEGAVIDVASSPMNISMITNNDDGLHHAIIGMGLTELYLSW